MAITNTIIGNTETDIKTAVGDEAITAVHFCNFNTTDEEVITLHARVGGASASDTNTIIKELNIPAGDTFVWTANEKYIISDTDVISAIGTNGSRVSATLSYLTL